ncbi:MAG: NAD(P)H-dependent oxidoreductase subunit E, partial [Actinomycetota bacterium]
MDLHLMSAAPTDEERSAVDELLGPADTGWVGGERGAGPERRFARGGRAAREQRDLLLPALHALQSRAGWISEGGLNYVCQRLTVPPAEAYGVATFYAMFSVEPRPKTVVHVCDDLACRIGGDALCGELERRFGAPGTVSADGSSTWLRSPCLGMCEQAPALLVQWAGADGQDAALGNADPGSVGSLLAGDRSFQSFSGGGHLSTPQTLDAAQRSGLRLLRRVGAVDPTSIDDYQAHGGYEALRRAHELGPDGVIREVTEARLMGRGGAAFPTGVKWKAVSEQPAIPHYFICNADESEPGTFKDRVVMEQDPFAVIEALTIAGYA